MKAGTLKCARLEFSGCRVKPHWPSAVKKGWPNQIWPNVVATWTGIARRGAAFSGENVLRKPDEGRSGFLQSLAGRGSRVVGGPRRHSAGRLSQDTVLAAKVFALSFFERKSSWRLHTFVSGRRVW